MNFINYIGMQETVSIEAFAKALSEAVEIWDFSQRDYHTGNISYLPEDKPNFNDVVISPTYAQALEVLEQIDEINEQYEYLVRVKYAHGDDDWAPVTFTRYGQEITFEVH